MEEESLYDVIIIGGSYSGLAAAMALGRALRKVLVIDGGKPCNRQTPHSHNFLTQDGRTPQEIIQLARSQVQAYETVNFLNGTVTASVRNAKGFEVVVHNDEHYTARKLIFATGIADRMPSIPGFPESWGISVLHCPYCHGYEVRGKTTGIIASGDTACELSSLILNWTPDLALYTNGNANLSAKERSILHKHQIPIIETPIVALQHERGHIHHLLLADGKNPAVQAVYARVPFVQHSGLPMTLGCELTGEGYLKIDGAHRTTVPGVFACGDNATRMRTVANAVATGTTTGIMVNKELIEEAFGDE